MCCARSTDGDWYCKGCRKKKEKTEFSQYIMTNGQKKNAFARCDMCRDKYEADNERIRQANKAMVVPSRIQPSLNTQTHMHEMVAIFVCVVMEKTHTYIYIYMCSGIKTTKIIVSFVNSVII